MCVQHHSQASAHHFASRGRGWPQENWQPPPGDPQARQPIVGGASCRVICTMAQIGRPMVCKHGPAVLGVFGHKTSDTRHQGARTERCAFAGPKKAIIIAGRALYRHVGHTTMGPPAAAVGKDRGSAGRNTNPAARHHWRYGQAVEACPWGPLGPGRRPGGRLNVSANGTRGRLFLQLLRRAGLHQQPHFQFSGTVV